MHLSIRCQMFLDALYIVYNPWEWRSSNRQRGNMWQNETGKGTWGSIVRHVSLQVCVLSVLQLPLCVAEEELSFVAIYSSEVAARVVSAVSLWCLGLCHQYYHLDGTQQEFKKSTVVSKSKQMLSSVLFTLTSFILHGTLVQ